MAAFFLLFHNQRALCRERVFRDRSNDLDLLNDRELIARYRFPRESIIRLTDIVKDLVERPTMRSHAIPAHTQVMTTLRLLAKGDYLSEVADTNGVSIPSASRVVHSVSEAICQRLDVEFPMEEQEQSSIKHKFYVISGFPNVLGAIDGTLIPIQGMSGDDEPSFVCRKQFHAINVQAIADAELRFINIVVKWPGSTHDAFILSNSHIPEIMETINDGWLLGDSGYPLKRWLMTPVANPQNQQETNYNKAHCRTRNTVERAFGVLKARFSYIMVASLSSGERCSELLTFARCLHKTGGALQFSPKRNCKIIGACFRLHNMAVNDRIPLPEYGEIPLENHDTILPVDNNSEAFAIRNRLIHRF